MPQLVDTCNIPLIAQNIATIGTSASGKASFRKSWKHLAAELPILKCLFSRQNRL
jgi:hypothetical protein